MAPRSCHLHPSVLPSENFADHQLLVSEYYASFNPTSPEERSFVDAIYRAWILRRLVRVETELFLYVYVHEQASTPSPIPTPRNPNNRGALTRNLSPHTEPRSLGSDLSQATDQP